jgi:ABC-type Mn2+/Zn2+ transport system ATPase subunit
MSSIVVSELAYSPPGADQLFFDVSVGVSPGEHAAIVGPNGVGKSTILKFSLVNMKQMMVSSVSAARFFR